eukprot:SAG22_NODE_171_length_16646_cov_6.580528_13_plen_151_part_00
MQMDFVAWSEWMWGVYIWLVFAVSVFGKPGRAPVDQRQRRLSSASSHRLGTAASINDGSSAGRAATRILGENDSQLASSLLMRNSLRHGRAPDQTTMMLGRPHDHGSAPRRACRGLAKAVNAFQALCAVLMAVLLVVNLVQNRLGLCHNC